MAVSTSSHRLYEGGSSKGKRIATSIDLSGPFFTYDPEQRYQKNVEIMLAAVAREGEEDVKAQVAPHNKSGFFYSGVKGRVTSMKGKHWYRTAVISQTNVWPWKNKGVRGFGGRGEAQYRGGKFEAKYKVFKRTAGRLRRSRAVNRAELTRGMN